MEGRGVLTQTEIKKETETRMKYVIKIEGRDLIGPFDTEKDAQKYVEDYLAYTDFEILPVTTALKL